MRKENAPQLRFTHCVAQTSYTSPFNAPLLIATLSKLLATPYGQWEEEGLAAYGVSSKAQWGEFHRRRKAAAFYDVMMGSRLGAGRKEVHRVLEPSERNNSTLSTAFLNRLAERSTQKDTAFFGI